METIVDFNKFPITQRMVMLEHFHSLEDRDLYRGSDFWRRLTTKINNDIMMEGMPHMTPTEIKSGIDYFLSLGTAQKNDDERYFDAHGEYYEDYCVPSYESDMEEEEEYRRNLEKESDNDDDDDNDDDWYLYN